MREQINHEDKWSKHLLESIYKDFFTDAEIEEIANGRDFWMAPEEVQKRLEARQKIYEKEAAKPKRAARKKS